MNGNCPVFIRLQYVHSNYFFLFISRVLVLEDEKQQECSVKRSAPISSLQGIAMELRAMKPLPKRRITRRTRSNSPPPIQDKVEVKRPRLSGTR